MYLCTHMHSIVIALPAWNLNIGLALLVKGINIIKPIETTPHKICIKRLCFGTWIELIEITEGGKLEDIITMISLHCCVVTYVGIFLYAPCTSRMSTSGRWFPSIWHWGVECTINATHLCERIIDFGSCQSISFTRRTPASMSFIHRKHTQVGMSIILNRNWY